MTNKTKRVGQQTVQQQTLLYKFLLRGETEFNGQFNQKSIKIKPTSLNGKPIELAVNMISKIQRVNNPGWKVSPKLMYFLFELRDGTRLSGLPNSKMFSVNTPFFEDYQVEFENILEVEQASA